MDEDQEFNVNTLPIKWNPDAVLTLIKLYKKWDLLYDQKNNLYHNKLVRANVWESICKSLQKVMPHVTVNDIKVKIHSIRSHFGKELGKLLESQRDGGETGVVYKPRIFYFKQLFFLKDYLNIKRNTPNTPNRSNHLDENSLSETEEPSRPRKRGRLMDENNLSETDEPLLSLDAERTGVEISLQETYDPLLSSKRARVEYDESSFSETDEPTSSRVMKTEENIEEEYDNDDVFTVNKNVTLKLSLAEKPTTPEHEYENSLTNFFRTNIREVKDKNLQDELSSKIMMLIFEYKRKQRELDSR